MTSLKSRQFDYSKLRNFISSCEMFKTTIKLCQRFFFHKINKNTRVKPEVKCYWDDIRGCDVTHNGFKIL